MSDRISRRKLLPLAPQIEKERFSLTDFYAKRDAVATSLPTFAVRPQASSIETTNVGVTRSSASRVNARAPSLPKEMPFLGGPVTVVQTACLAWQGTSCRACSERCPVPGVISLDRGRPTIAVLQCTGCGECVRACPAPHNALKLAEHFPSS